MLSANEIRNVRFSKSMSGYKQEEVDVILDKVEADYEQFERTVREMASKIEQLKGEIEDYKSSQGNIQNVLVSAQKFADQIVEEAKTKSAEIISAAQDSITKITAQEKELTTAFDKKASERKESLQKDVDAIIATAEKKQAAIDKATADSINRQQLLFNKMKVEVASFKAEITQKYKEHLELLSSLPDAVLSDPTEIAAAITAKFDTAPDIVAYVENPALIENITEPVAEKTDVTEKVEIPETVESSTPVAEKPAKSNLGGFVINADSFGIGDDTDSDNL